MSSQNVLKYVKIFCWFKKYSLQEICEFLWSLAYDIFFLLVKYTMLVVRDITDFLFLKIRNVFVVSQKKMKKF